MNTMTGLIYKIYRPGVKEKFLDGIGMVPPGVLMDLMAVGAMVDLLILHSSLGGEPVTRTSGRS